MDQLRSNTPRWVIFLIDIAIVAFSLGMAYLLRFNFSVPDGEIYYLKYVIPIVFAVRAISFVVSRLYAGIVRYTSTHDFARIFIVSLIGSTVFVLVNLVSYYAFNWIFVVPFSIIILEFLITVFVMTFSRLLVKALYLEYKSPSRNRNPVIIVGTGELAMIAKRTFDRSSESPYQVVAFIDPAGLKTGNKLENATIYSLAQLSDVIEKFSAHSVVFASKEISAESRYEVTETCLQKQVKILTIPDVNQWINGELSFNQLKSLKIEDLLERDSIHLNKDEIRRQVVGKTVMVTGAAGSIGSEMVIQLTQFSPKNIILFDQAETELHDLELTLNEVIRFTAYKSILGDITNAERLEYIIERYRPDIIYHAAAYKHVPMMEKNPAEAILTNIRGTKILANMAHKYKVAKFVMISTDKAVNPTNVMGASKRIAEMYTQSFNSVSDTAFITTRFGNVLGSNGSVIPRFRKQIEDGGPVTVTHPEVTRYFMTIPEACQLVLEAGAMGKGGEIYIFDMGKSVKIADLAKKMIRLSGLELGKDIEIRFTGLRPGEKIYEELLNDSENTLPTHHPKIMIARVAENNHESIEVVTGQLIEAVARYDNYEIVRIMKKMVPEFKSSNSQYEVLDEEKPA
ncbi:MAG: polysaccharide biosynthesis protein [Bacteroidetes bacterium HGW-Bacteroidetes-21]|nr:MAG: polysaccharide biosynthesis protein [Bacteroidetes bacterium HGW-Bacteroidetes-21]